MTRFCLLNLKKILEEGLKRKGIGEFVRFAGWQFPINKKNKVRRRHIPLEHYPLASLLDCLGSCCCCRRNQLPRKVLLSRKKLWRDVLRNSAKEGGGGEEEVGAVRNAITTSFLGTLVWFFSLSPCLLAYLPAQSAFLSNFILALTHCWSFSHSQEKEEFGERDDFTSLIWVFAHLL